MKRFIVDYVPTLAIYMTLFFIMIGIFREFAFVIGDFFFRLFKRILKQFAKK